MRDASPAEIQRLLGDEFERRGWHYDLKVGRAIVEAAQARGAVDPAKLAALVPSEFLARARASREDMAAAIRAAIGDRTPQREIESTTTVVINDHRYSVNVAAHAHVGNINVAGTQINVDANADRSDVLAALSALLAAGLRGEWNRAAARDLSSIIDARPDVGLDDVQQVTQAVVQDVQPTKSRATELLRDIAVSGLGGALGTGISVAVGQALGTLPG